MKDQGGSGAGKSGSVKFQALLISVMVHLIVLSVFLVVRFSKAGDFSKRAIPMAQVTAVKKLTQAQTVISKPKIKRPLEDISTKRISKPVLENPDFETAKPKSIELQELTKSSTAERVSLAEDSGVHHSVEFFGASTDSRKICYLVDSSGSMKGIFSRVQKELKDSIGTLLADQYFCIIFFGDERLSEFGGGKLIRATEDAKSGAYDFIDSTQPFGQTNAMAALERALQIRDGGGAGPSVIYFLTDGFELSTDIREFSQKTSVLLKRFAPRTKINTIGFWPAESDRRMLEIVAQKSGGQAVFIADEK